MRIDFGASYKEISKLLRASTDRTPAAKPGDFARSLGSLIRTEPQTPEIKVVPPESPPAAPPPSAPREDIRASYKFPEPDLELPLITPQPPPIERIETPTPIQGSVKTPTVLAVERVDLQTDPIAPKVNMAMDRAHIGELLTKASEDFKLNPKLSTAVVRAESDFNHRAVSTDGHESKGLFQLLDSTGRGLLARGGNPNRQYDPFDAQMNVELGTSYLRYLHDIFSTPTQLPNEHATRAGADDASREKLAVAAFNAGEGRVASAQTRAEKAGKDPARYEDVAPYLPASTRQYVQKVIGGKLLF